MTLKVCHHGGRAGMIERREEAGDPRFEYDREHREGGCDGALRNAAAQGSTIRGARSGRREGRRKAVRIKRLDRGDTDGRLLAKGERQSSTLPAQRHHP